MDTRGAALSLFRIAARDEPREPVAPATPFPVTDLVSGETYLVAEVPLW